jgi:ribosomal subunit interface protein
MPQLFDRGGARGMNVIIKGVHLRLTAGLKQYVHEHLVEPIERFYRNPAGEAEVHLCDDNGPKGGEDKVCRVTVRIAGARTVHVEVASDNMYKSIDFARDRLERAAKRQLSRRRQRSPGSVSKPLGRLGARAAARSEAREEGATAP